MLLKEHVFTYGDNKAKPFIFDIDELDRHYAFMKFDDKLKLLPGQSHDKAPPNNTASHLLNEDNLNEYNTEGNNDEMHWLNKNYQQNGYRNNQHFNQRKNQYQRHNQHQYNNKSEQCRICSDWHPCKECEIFNLVQLQKEIGNKVTDQQLRTAHQSLLVDAKNNKGMPNQKPLNPIFKKNYSANDKNNKSTHRDASEDEADNQEQEEENDNAMGSSIATIKPDNEENSLLYNANGIKRITKSYISKLFSGN